MNKIRRGIEKRIQPPKFKPQKSRYFIQGGAGIHYYFHVRGLQGYHPLWDWFSAFFIKGLMQKSIIWAFCFFSIPQLLRRGCFSFQLKGHWLPKNSSSVFQNTLLWGPFKSSNQLLGPWGSWDFSKGIQIGKELKKTTIKI